MSTRYASTKFVFIGDPVAAVAAIDEDTAFEAMTSSVEYETLNTISSIEEAILIDEPRIHEYGDEGTFIKGFRSNLATSRKARRS